jgi:putative aminopeptidase FrvX
MGGNDSGNIHTKKEGSITATISVPCRNIHSPTSVMSKKDYDNTYRLLRAIIKDFEKGELVNGF